jgi:hypothetical protein
MAAAVGADTAAGGAGEDERALLGARRPGVELADGRLVGLEPVELGVLGEQRPAEEGDHPGGIAAGRQVAVDDLAWPPHADLPLRGANGHFNRTAFTPIAYRPIRNVRRPAAPRVTTPSYPSHDRLHLARANPPGATHGRAHTRRQIAAEAEHNESS